MLSTPFPETILCDGHSSASGTTAFATCKSLHLNFCRVLPKVSFRYLLVEDKQGTSVVSVFLSNFTTETQRATEFTQRNHFERFLGLTPQAPCFRLLRRLENQAVFSLREMKH